MKKGKVVSIVTAGIMALAALPALPAGAAEEIYCLGDVDMDHVITGHDAAMVTRYLNVDPHLLTEEQLMLADVNEDGVVDQSDATGSTKIRGIRWETVSRKAEIAGA